MPAFRASVDRSIARQPLLDRVYSKLFQGSTIHRLDNSSNRDDDNLDKLKHIDLQVVYPDGKRITIQEKCCSYSEHHFGTFTCEFQQDRHTNRQGEFFDCKADLYMHSYINETGDDLLYWAIIRWPAFLEYASKLDLSKHTRNVDKADEKASFLYFYHRDLPDRLYHSYNLYQCPKTSKTIKPCYN